MLRLQVYLSWRAEVIEMVSKRIVSILTMVFVIFLLSCNNVYALDCYQESSGYPAPLPSQIICPFVRVINLALLLVGAVLIAMIVLGAIKMAVSLGDPKALQGAKLTWTYAIIGTFVVLGSFFILFLINKTFGLGINLFERGNAAAGIFEKIQENIRSFMESIFVYEQG